MRPKSMDTVYGRKEMFYLTTHSTHFILRLYGVGDTVYRYCDVLGYSKLCIENCTVIGDYDYSSLIFFHSFFFKKKKKKVTTARSKQARLKKERYLIKQDNITYFFDTIIFFKYRTRQIEITETNK